METFAKIIQELRSLLQLLLDTYGTAGTIAIVIGAVAVVTLYRVYADWRKDTYIKKLLQDKDRQIQRLAEQERNYRIHFFKMNGWTDVEIDLFVMKGDFQDAVTARKALEGEPDDLRTTGQLQKPQPGKKKKKK